MSYQRHGLDSSLFMSNILAYSPFCMYCYRRRHFDPQTDKSTEDCDSCMGVGRNPLPWSELFRYGRYGLLREQE